MEKRYGWPETSWLQWSLDSITTRGLQWIIVKERAWWKLENLKKRQDKNTEDLHLLLWHSTIFLSFNLLWCRLRIYVFRISWWLLLWLWSSGIWYCMWVPEFQRKILCPYSEIQQMYPTCSISQNCCSPVAVLHLDPTEGTRCFPREFYVDPEDGDSMFFLSTCKITHKTWRC
jgi:hypothetical protein